MSRVVSLEPPPASFIRHPAEPDPLPPPLQVVLQGGRPAPSTPAPSQTPAPRPILASPPLPTSPHARSQHLNRCLRTKALALPLLPPLPPPTSLAQPPVTSGSPDSVDTWGPHLFWPFNIRRLFSGKFSHGCGFQAGTPTPLCTALCFPLKSPQGSTRVSWCAPATCPGPQRSPSPSSPSHLSDALLLPTRLLDTWS